VEEGEALCGEGLTQRAQRRRQRPYLARSASRYGGGGGGRYNGGGGLGHGGRFGKRRCGEDEDCVAHVGRIRMAARWATSENSRANTTEASRSTTTEASQTTAPRAVSPPSPNEGLNLFLPTWIV
jgi:hypothetical protein